MARDSLQRANQMELQRDQIHSPMRAKMVADLDPVGDFMRGYGQAQGLRLQQRQAELSELQAYQQMDLARQQMDMQGEELSMRQQDQQIQAVERRSRLATEHLKRKELLARMGMMDREYDLRAKAAQTRMAELEFRKQQDQWDREQRKDERRASHKASYAGKVFPNGKGGHFMFVPNPGSPGAPLKRVDVPANSPLLKSGSGGESNQAMATTRNIKNVKELDDIIRYSGDPDQVAWAKRQKQLILGGRSIVEPPTWTNQLQPGVYEELRAKGWSDTRIKARLDQIRGVDKPKKEQAAPSVKNPREGDDAFFREVDAKPVKQGGQQVREVSGEQWEIGIKQLLKQGMSREDAEKHVHGMGIYLYGTAPRK